MLSSKVLQLCELPLSQGVQQYMKNLQFMLVLPMALYRLIDTEFQLTKEDSVTDLLKKNKFRYWISINQSTSMIAVTVLGDAVYYDVCQEIYFVVVSNSITTLTTSS